VHVRAERQDQAVACVVAEEELVKLGAFVGGLGAAGKHGLLVLAEGGFDVVGVRGDGIAQW
jgi:hypothetical protein